MESNFNNRDFEQFIKRNADQYRMIPSEKVWKGINNILHTRRRWYGIGLTSLLLLTAIAVSWVMVSNPVSKKQSANTIQHGGIAAASPANSNSSNSNKRDLKDLVFKRANNPYNDLLSSNEIVSSLESNQPGELPQVVENRIDDAVLLVSVEKTPAVTSNRNTNVEPVITSVAEESMPDDLGTTTGVNLREVKPADSWLLHSSSANRTVYMPLTIESVVNNYTAQKIKRKLSWQVYFAPTVSYRKLNENKSFPSSAPFNSGNYIYPFISLSDVNKAVTHKPDMGLELGLAAKYPLTQSLKLTGGLQFNINRYDIKAFVYNGEQATINLTGDNSSLTPWTYYRNYNGYKSDWLKNFYFSVSAPLGAELKLIGNSKRTYLGVATTVQPTYIIGDRAYLLSTDYKNYAEVPTLIRRVNVNTSFETFISYKGRSTRWQVGPQIRYQVLSSFKDKYPVRENLFDYGVKIGITLNH